MSRVKTDRATLDVVAARAGVSKATASKVLNHRPGVSADTRRRVEQAMIDLGYAPTTAGRDPRATRTVTAVFDTLVNLYSLRVLEGAIQGAQEHGADLVAVTLATGEGGTDPHRLTPENVRAMAGKGHTGVIVVTTPLHQGVVAAAHDQGLHLVTVDPPNTVDESVVSIGSHHWTGGLQATRHLIGLGHRRIAFVGGAPANLGLRERFGGYREALDAAGLTPDPALISQEGMGSAEAAVTGMLDLRDPPTAVFASNDGDAFAAVRAAQRRGLRVPDDLSVVGYDDTYAAIGATLQLTTVRTPMHEIGRMAARMLLTAADGQEPVSRQVRLATTLVIRETTAPPPLQ